MDTMILSHLVEVFVTHDRRAKANLAFSGPVNPLFYLRSLIHLFFMTGQSLSYFPVFYEIILKNLRLVESINSKMID